MKISTSVYRSIFLFAVAFVCITLFSSSSILYPLNPWDDANGNGEVEIGDVTSVLTLMATPEATGYNNKAADANQNGIIRIADVTKILDIMAGN
jgi:hypothetical protein